MRPHVVAPSNPTTIRPGLHNVPARMQVNWHMSCVAWLTGGYYADKVHLKNEGPGAIPRGTTVYWYTNDRRQWGLHRFALGLAPGQWVLAQMPGIAGGGAPCTVVSHKLAWMGLQPPKPAQGMQRRPQPLSPAAGLHNGGSEKKAGPKAVLRIAYHLSCKFKEFVAIGSVMSGGSPQGASAVFTNNGPGPVPAGTTIWFDINGTRTGRGGKILTRPLGAGEQLTMNFWPTDHIESHMTCKAHAQ
jgi:hypothetical protein